MTPHWKAVIRFCYFHTTIAARVSIFSSAWRPTHASLHMRNKSSVFHYISVNDMAFHNFTCTALPVPVFPTLHLPVTIMMGY